MSNAFSTLNAFCVYVCSVHVHTFNSRTSFVCVIPPNGGVNKHEFVLSCFLPSRQQHQQLFFSAIGQQSQTSSRHAQFSVCIKSCCDFPVCETIANLLSVGVHHSVTSPPNLTLQLFLTVTFTQVYLSFLMHVSFLLFLDYTHTHTLTSSC